MVPKATGAEGRLKTLHEPLRSTRLSVQVSPRKENCFGGRRCQRNSRGLKRRLGKQLAILWRRP